MSRICIAVLMTVMICCSGCGPSVREIELDKREAEVAKREAEVAKREAKTSEIVTMLIEAGADVNAKGKTPLSVAKKPEIIKLLKDEEATNKLLSACSKGHWPNYPKADYIRVLIGEGADVNAKDKYGKTPLMYAKNLEIRQILKAAGAKE